MGTGEKILAGGVYLRWTSKIAILLVASCFANRDKLRQLLATRLVKTLYNYLIIKPL